MSERKVINKYFPPDFDPSKIKRRKIGKDPQQVIRLMAPFSMRCNRCGEYVYKGKKFNARKETAQGEEYYGIRVFRFYIIRAEFQKKCPTCSSEITFKTDPKNADYICEHGATRNFENWSDAEGLARRTIMPDAAEDDEYDSDGNPLESKKERDAMADLERTQEQSRREMEMMDELADLRQRNARLELSNVAADPESLLATLHAERQNAAEAARQMAEQEEDDALVAQYFSKVAAGSFPEASEDLPTNGSSKRKGKGKEKAHDTNGIDNDHGDEAEDEKGDDDEDQDDAIKDDGSESGSDNGMALPTVTIKRRPAPESNVVNRLNGAARSAEPSVASLLAAKGKTLDHPTNGTNGSAAVHANGNGVNGSSAAKAAAQKRKREGMQKLLGIKKKVNT